MKVPDYDVRSVAILKKGTVAFAAKHNGRVSLFRIEAGGQPEPWLSRDADIGSFAMSPPGDRIAFTQLVHHRWQLFVMPLTFSQATQLTFAGLQCVHACVERIYSPALRNRLRPRCWTHSTQYDRC